MPRFQNAALSLVRRFLIKSGAITRYWKKLPNGVYVFNFHRIGDALNTEFDRAVFSCSESAFREQVEQINENFEVINLERFLALKKSGDIASKRYALLTFDDSYIDNYTIAAPILTKMSLPATFFVVTDFIESKQLPWWDEMAFILRNSANLTYRQLETNKEYLLAPHKMDQIIQDILYRSKRLQHHTITQVLNDLRKQFPQASQRLSERSYELFMDWSQLSALQQKGFDIGSHTVSHRILSKLTQQEQEQEISGSKDILERMLGSPISAVAYPVGRANCFNAVTLEVAQAAGYKAAFNNEPGLIKVSDSNFNLHRICVNTDKVNEMKFSVCFPEYYS